MTGETDNLTNLKNNLTRAKRLMESGELDEALELCKSTVAANMNSPAAHDLLFKAFSMHRDFDALKQFYLGRLKNINTESALFLLKSAVVQNDISGAMYFLGRFSEVFNLGIRAAFDNASADTKTAMIRRKDDILRQVDRTVEQDRIGAGTRPSYVRRLVRMPATDIRNFRGVRVAVLFDKHIFKSPLYLENEVLHLFIDSCRSLNFDARPFYLDKIPTYDFLKQETAPTEIAEALGALRQELLAYGPDIIIFDANFESAEGGLSGAYLSDLARTLDAKLIGWNGDTWQPNFRDVVNSWIDHVDLILHSDTNREEDFDEAVRSKILWVHPITPSSMMHQTVKNKTRKITFCGSLRIERTLEILQLWLLNVPIEVYGGERLIATSPSPEAYAELMQESAASYCPPTSGATISTGRFYDAISARTLPIERAGATSTALFVPYLHYLPYADVLFARSAYELAQENPELGQAIVARAHDLMRNHYSHERYWQIILKRLYA